METDSEYEGSSLSGADSDDFVPSRRRSGHGSQAVEPVLQKALQSRRNRKSNVQTKISEIAKISKLAIDQLKAPSDSEDRLSQVDSGVLQRIRKMCTLAQHSGTGEAEAKAALRFRLASSLMAKVNITQADIMAQEPTAEQSLRAGMSTVSIILNPAFRRRGQARKESAAATCIQSKGWHGICATAIQEFFNVKSFSTQCKGASPKMKITFYGIAANTVAAAHAFEMVHNTILTWSHERKDLKGRVAHSSYRNGVACGLWDTAIAEQRAEEQKAIENERKYLADRVKKEDEERHSKLARLQDPAIAPSRQPSHPSQPEPSNTLGQPDQGATSRGHVGRKVEIEEIEDEDGPLGSFCRNPVNQPAHSNPITVHPEDETPSDWEPDDDIILLEIADDVPPDVDGSDVGSGFYASDVEHDFDGSEADSEEDAAITRELQEAAMGKPPLRSPSIASNRSSNPGLEGEPPKTDTPSENDAERGWQTALQLTKFRSTATDIADEFLKTKNLKLKNARKRRAGKLDLRAHKEGQEDSKNIDVKRRRLE